MRIVTVNQQTLNIKKNKPVKISDDELGAIFEWIPEMRSIYGEAIDILCKGHMPSQIDIQFFYCLKENELAKTASGKTAFLLTTLLEADIIFVGGSFPTSYIEGIVKNLNGLTETELHRLNEALIKRNIIFCGPKE